MATHTRRRRRKFNELRRRGKQLWMCTDPRKKCNLAQILLFATYV